MEAIDSTVQIYLGDKFSFIATNKRHIAATIESDTELQK